MSIISTEKDRYSILDAGFNHNLSREVNVAPPPDMQHSFVDSPGSLILGDQAMGGELSFGHQMITVGVGGNIQKAINEIEKAGGGIVRLLADRYRPDYDIVIPSSVTLQGDGRDGTIIDYNSQSFGIKVTGTAGSRVKNVRIKDLTIQESRDATGAIYFQYAQHFIIDNDRFSNNTNSGLVIRASQQYKVDNCLGDNNGANSFRLVGAADYSHARFTFFGCVADSNTGSGFNVSSDASLLVGNGSFVACESDNNTLDGFNLDNGNIEAAIFFDNCIANSNTVNGFDVNIAHSSFVECKADSNGGDGFENTGTRNSFVGCVPDNNTGEDFNSTVRCSFIGNQLKFAAATDPSSLMSHDDVAVQSIGNTGGNTLTEKGYMQMKNTSGGTLAQGAVVTLKAVASGDEVTTTTTAGDDLVFGMAMFSQDNNSYGAILTEGHTTKLKVDGTDDIAVGDELSSFTSVGIAKKASSGEMVFSIALEAYATDDSSGVIDALLIKPRKIGPGIPSGTITMWHGTIVNIPNGWLICDGNNGTPNLLGRFVEGVATAATDPGTTGGATAKTTDVTANFSNSGGGSTQEDAKDHAHAISDIRPKFYDVAFIMKS